MKIEGSTPGCADKFFWLLKFSRWFEIGMWNDHPRYWNGRWISGWFGRHINQLFIFRISLWLRIP